MNGWPACATGPRSGVWWRGRVERSWLSLAISSRWGPGVFEMRGHFGPGWRMYFVRRGKQLIAMPGGGEK
jgi:putative addiction module killer protein